MSLALLTSLSDPDRVLSQEQKIVDYSDWKEQRDSLPFSEVITVRSPFETYEVVFDKDFKRLGGDGFFLRYDEVGIFSRWTRDSLSIAIYSKNRCDVLGCLGETAAVKVQGTVEVQVNGEQFNLSGENGDYFLPPRLIGVIRDLKVVPRISMRLIGNNDLIYNIGESSAKAIQKIFNTNDPTEAFVVSEGLAPVVPKIGNEKVQAAVGFITPTLLQVETPRGTGSAFFVSSNGFAITNRHVVARFTKVKVKTYDGQSLDADVVKRSTTSDIALIRVKVNSDNFSSAPLCFAAIPSVGTDVLAIGNPLSYTSTVTRGIVSAVRRNEYETLIQTDAPVNPGNSGGPLINYQGEVIGVVSSKLAGGVEGIGFAISIQSALDSLQLKINKVASGELTECGNPVSQKQIPVAPAAKRPLRLK